jgi:phage-related protein
MPSIDTGCHELRVTDGGGEWRLVYALTATSVAVLDVFRKTTRATPPDVVRQCARRLRDYERSAQK